MADCPARLRTEGALSVTDGEDDSPYRRWARSTHTVMKLGRNDSPSACHLIACGHSQCATAEPLDQVGNAASWSKAAEAVSARIALAGWLSFGSSSVKGPEPGEVSPAVLPGGACHKAIGY